MIRAYPQHSCRGGETGLGQSPTAAAYLRRANPLSCWVPMPPEYRRHAGRCSGTHGMDRSRASKCVARSLRGPAGGPRNSPNRGTARVALFGFDRPCHEVETIPFRTRPERIWVTLTRHLMPGCGGSMRRQTMQLNRLCASRPASASGTRWAAPSWVLPRHSGIRAAGRRVSFLVTDLPERRTLATHECTCARFLLAAAPWIAKATLISGTTGPR
jgi:hypothetical protein